MVTVLEWKYELKKHKYLIALSLLFFAIATILTYLAGIYVSNTQGSAVQDLILDHLPVVDLSFIFVFGEIAIIAAIFLYPLFFNVKELHKAASQLSLLILVRAIFICFTHLQAPAGAVSLSYPWPFTLLDFRNDLFFSGHTAIPFLGFLVFKNSRIRWVFLAASIVMAITVLLMHVHYSIDVLSAFFITYGTYKIGEWFFKRVGNDGEKQASTP
jgi:hypothetical protein